LKKRKREAPEEEGRGNIAGTSRTSPTKGGNIRGEAPWGKNQLLQASSLLNINGEKSSRLLKKKMSQRNQKAEGGERGSKKKRDPPKGVRYGKSGGSLENLGGKGM